MKRTSEEKLSREERRNKALRVAKFWENKERKLNNIDNKTEEKPETVTITKKEYESLLEDSKLLRALENAGVDNWGGYDFARELLDEE